MYYVVSFIVVPCIIWCLHYCILQDPISTDRLLPWWSTVLTRIYIEFHPFAYKCKRSNVEIGQLGYPNGLRKFFTPFTIYYTITIIIVNTKTFFFLPNYKSYINILEGKKEWRVLVFDNKDRTRIWKKITYLI